MDAPSLRPDIRTLLELLFRTDVELDAFCIDFFPETHKLYSAAMSRMQKLNILLEREEQDAIVIMVKKHVLSQSQKNFSIMENYQGIIVKYGLSPVFHLTSGYSANVPDGYFSHTNTLRSHISFGQQTLESLYRDSVRVLSKSLIWVEQDKRCSFNAIIKNEISKSIIIHGIKVNARYQEILCSRPALESGPIMQILHEIDMPTREGSFVNEFDNAIRVASDDAIKIKTVLNFEQESQPQNRYPLLILNYDLELMVDDQLIPCPVHLSRVGAKVMNW